MAESTNSSEAKGSYPYLSAKQWNGIRASLKQSVPKTIDIDWVIAKLDTTQKSAQNVLPQLRTLGLVDGEGRPSDDLIPDLRDDETYASACERIVERVYAEGLRNAYSEADADLTKVAAWFARNAGTGDTMSKNQARLYLLLLGGVLPTADDSASPKPRRKPPTPKSTPHHGAAMEAGVQVPRKGNPPALPDANPSTDGAPSVSPSLHIDLQIHISADAGDAQIEAIFKSMAKHLYGR